MKSAIHNAHRDSGRLAVRWIEGAWTPQIDRAEDRPQDFSRCSTLPERRYLLPDVSPRSPRRHNRFRGFTLIELLIVMAIIGLLTALLLPALAALREKQRKHQARLEMKSIEVALTTYYSAYSQYPRPNNASIDTTFGTGTIGTTAGVENSELMAILLNEDQFSNTNHVKNPRGIVDFNPNRTYSTNVSGLGPDLVFRDPWGRPYIISIDYNYNNRCQDEFYRLATVSQTLGDVGYNGLSRTPPNTGDTFELPGAIMIWSLGPDGKADATQPANKGANKDNVLNWTN